MTILFLSASASVINNIFTILQVFQRLSRLVNLAKSSLAGINFGEETTMSRLAGYIVCDMLFWAFNYLVVPLGGNPYVESFSD